MIGEAAGALLDELNARGGVSLAERQQLGNIATIAQEINIDPSVDGWFSELLREVWSRYEAEELDCQDTHISASTLAALNWDDELRKTVSAFVAEEINSSPEEVQDDNEN